MSSLPPGWGNRTNQMSEEDIKRGGVAATKFASKQKQLQQSVYNDDDASGSGAAGGVPSYKSSDDVRQLYLKRIEAEEQAAAAANVSQLTGAGASESTAEKGTSVLPSGWEDRQKAREVEAKQYGVFGRKKEGPPPPPTASAPQKGGDKRATTASSSAEEALVRVATHTLDNMAMALENNTVNLSAEDRAAFAEAMKRAMTAISRC